MIDVGDSILRAEAVRLNGDALLEKSKAPDFHPSGKESYGRLMRTLRAIGFVVFFQTCAACIFLTQYIGLPLYFINKDWYYAHMAMTKNYFAIMATYLTNIWSPTLFRVSGDESVTGQILPASAGGIEFRFPERIVLIANHQIYTDWLYLWLVSYMNSPALGGHIYIMLKESLKYIPLTGLGMVLYGFIFMSRKMATDQSRIAHRLRKLSQKKTGPKGETYYDPMWLMLFPEGTNISGTGRKKSAAWAEKTGVKDCSHMMLPRSTGLFFSLNQLKGTVDYLYDCTVAYEGVPRGRYGEEFYSLSSTYFAGRSPKSVNFYWRRFHLSDIPLDDPEEFNAWLREQWYKKDALMEEYLTTGRFPAMAGEVMWEGKKLDYAETEVRPRQWWEIIQIFAVVGTAGLLLNNVLKAKQVAATFLGL